MKPSIIGVTTWVTENAPEYFIDSVLVVYDNGNSKLYRTPDTIPQTVINFLNKPNLIKTPIYKSGKKIKGFLYYRGYL